MPEPPSRQWLVHPRFWPGWFGLALLRALSALPLPVLAFLGRGLGSLLYVFPSSRRRAVHRNIERCFPAFDRRARGRLVHAHFRAFGQGVFDVGIAWWASSARLERLIRFRGREHYDRALAAKRNIILLVPHFVAMEIGGMRLTMERPVAVMFRHPKDALLRRVMERVRPRFHARLIAHDAALTALVRQICSGVPFYYLPDQNAPRRKAVFAPFFGVPAATYAVLPRLARVTNAVVIPCATRQLPYGRGYEIIFHPPLADFPSADTTTDVTRINAAIEQLVRGIPEQYFWVHRRFRTRPKGEPDFYA